MTNKKIVEVISPFSDLEPIHRMKVLGLAKGAANEFSFHELGKADSLPSIILINCLHLDLVKNADFIKVLEQRSKNAVVMLLMADFYPSSLEYFQLWEKYVDVFLVPTPEMRDFVKIFTKKSVNVLIDPIDFGLIDSRLAKVKPSSPLKVVWFGYPESYAKSMEVYAGALANLHRLDEIEFHIVSKNDQYGKFDGGIMHEYCPDTFLELLGQFDVAVLSHFPFDFSISTQWKSENKAVLAINRGLPVIASRTPAYERLLGSCGLTDYLFSTADELVDAISRLKNPKTIRDYLSLSQNFVLEEYSIAKLSNDFKKIFQDSQKL